MSARVRDECCNVMLNDAACEAPAACYPQPASLLVSCFKCGNDVCRKCSEVKNYGGRRCRLCNDCREDLAQDAAPQPSPEEKR